MCPFSCFQATGDMNKLIMIWEAATCKHVYKFTGHRGPVSVSLPSLWLQFPPPLYFQFFPCLWLAVLLYLGLILCFFPRGWRSGEVLTTCTAPHTIAQSKCGTWMRTPMWKLCKLSCSSHTGLNVKLKIQIQYMFYQIQGIAPHYPHLSVMCVHSKTPWCLYSPGSGNGETNIGACTEP